MIRDLVAEGNYVVGKHVSERLEERIILDWRTVVGLADEFLLLERLNEMPNPAVEVRETLPDGRYGDSSRLVALETVYRREAGDGPPLRSVGSHANPGRASQDDAAIRERSPTLTLPHKGEGDQTGGSDLLRLRSEPHGQLSDHLEGERAGAGDGGDEAGGESGVLIHDRVQAVGQVNDVVRAGGVAEVVAAMVQR